MNNSNAKENVCLFVIVEFLEKEFLLEEELKKKCD